MVPNRFFQGYHSLIKTSFLIAKKYQSRNKIPPNERAKNYLYERTEKIFKVVISEE